MDPSESPYAKKPLGAATLRYREQPTWDKGMCWSVFVWDRPTVLVTRHVIPCGMRLQERPLLIAALAIPSSYDWGFMDRSEFDSILQEGSQVRIPLVETKKSVTLDGTRLVLELPDEGITLDWCQTSQPKGWEDALLWINRLLALLDSKLEVRYWAGP